MEQAVGRTRRHYRKARAKVYRFISPRLGVLRQYPPRKLRLPAEPLQCPHGTQLPRFSIVTPSFQQGRFLRQSIDSVLGQNYPHFEYFVQDGGSTDDSLAVLRNCNGRLSGWASGSDKGQAHAINLAFEKTSGELMAWLNSDDLLMPGTLHRVADYFERHPDVSVIYGNRILIDEDGMEIGRWVLPDHDGDILKWIDYVPQETLFWRRSAWEAVGGALDESLQFALDWDFLLRLQAAGAKFARLPHFLGAFRVHPRQKTSEHLDTVGAQEVAQLRRRHLGYRPSGKEVSEKVKWYLYRHLAEHTKFRLQDWMKF